MKRKRSDDGRPRPAAGAAVKREDVTDALARTFFAEWARVGYRQLSLERVAREAGSGKAAIYRRWPDKEAMAVDLLTRVGLNLTEAEDTGSLDGDVLSMLRGIRRVLRHPLIRRILVDLHSELARSPALARAARPFQDERRRLALAVIERAVRRGEIPADVDREIAADLLAAPLYWRMVVLGARIDEDRLERLTRHICAALRG